KRKSTGGDRGGRNKNAPPQVEREACRIFSGRFRLCFSWQLGIPISRGERKVVVGEMITTPMAPRISFRLVSDRGRPMATGPHARRVTKRGRPPSSQIKGV